MEWIVVKPQGSLNSYDRAKAITRELYNVSRPVYMQRDSESTATCFEMITHPKDDNQAALIVDTDYRIRVHENCNLERLTACFPELTASKRYNLAAFIHQNNDVRFGDILPDTVTVRDKRYMLNEGWDVNDE